jgi:prepilin-type N-terminal cleavage/methylation domain-containing protein
MGGAHSYGQMFKSSGGFARGSKGNHGGFTLLEMLVATALLGLLAGSSIWALTQANNYASIARLYTGAETAAQNQIDLILTESPFNPQANPPEIPLPLTVGTSAPQTVTLYSEPAGAGGQTHTVTGQMVTTVVSNNVLTQGQNLNLYSATVVVTYTYRSKVYRVQLNAMRASDV